MHVDRVEFRFRPDVNLDDVEATTKLSFLGASGQHPAPIIRLYARYQLNRARRTIVVIGAEDIIGSISALMVTFLERELGAGAFTTDFKPARAAAHGPSTAA